MCRVCGWNREHVWEECWSGVEGKLWQEMVGEVLEEEEEGEGWLRKLEELREGRKEREGRGMNEFE